MTGPRAVLTSTPMQARRMPRERPQRDARRQFRVAIMEDQPVAEQQAHHLARPARHRRARGHGHGAWPCPVAKASSPSCTWKRALGKQAEAAGMIIMEMA